MSVDDRYRTWDAAYVLGALSGDERLEYEDHLAGCSRCRAEVGELSGMPGLLSMLDVDDVTALDHEQPDPPLRPEVLTAVLTRAGTRRNRARWMTLAGVGLVAALLAVAMLVVLRPETFGLPSGTGDREAAQMSKMTKVSETPINASVAVTGYGWGTRIDMACAYGDWGRHDAPPQNLGMVVVGHDGSRSQIATWLGLSGATALPSGTTPMSPDDIATVQLVSAPDGKVLLETHL